MTLIRFICIQKILSEPKYHFLIEKRENAGIKHLNDLKAFIECSNTIDDVYEDIDSYNPTRKRNILIVFVDMIADIMSNKKYRYVLKELFIRCRKLNISLIYHSILFFCSKRCQIKFSSLFDSEN